MKSEIGDDKNPENKDLEEGEIGVSDEEEKIEEVDDENAKWINRLSGSLRPVTRKRVLLETPGGVDESHTYEGKPKKPRYFDYDQMQGEDDWSSNTMPSAKGKRGRSGRENFIWAVPTSKKTDSSTTSEGTPNGFSLPRERSCIDMAAAKTMRLGALCHIKTKTKKRKSHGKRRKMKPRVKDSPVCEDRPPCKYFLEGHCAKGAECPFYHPFMKIKKLCKFYSGGNCRRGKDCNFMHEEFPCKFYHTGAICYSDENCRFSHKPLTEEMKKILNDFLNGSSSDDNTDEDTSPEQSKSKQPVVKRPCILGSPPRHIKESQETKEWQAEMRRLRHSSERHSAAFKIKITRVKEVSSPGKPSRLNFYTDTLLHASGSANESSPLSKVLPSALLPLCNVPNQNSPGSISKESGKCQASGSSMADKLPPLITMAPASRKKSVKQENEKSESPNSRSFGSISKALGLPDITLPPIRVPNYTPREPLKPSDPVLHYQKKTSSERDVDTENASIKQEFPKAKVDEVHESFYYNSEEDDDDFYCSEDDYDGSTEVEDDILIDDLEMQDREPCPEITADSMLNNGSRVKSARQKLSADVKSNTGEETNAYWEDILCNPAPLSPVTENHSSSPVDTVPPLLEDFRLHDLTRASDLPLDLRVKCNDSRKTDFPTDPRLKNKQQKRPAGDIFSSLPLLTEPRTANQPPSRDDALLLKPNPVIVSEGLHDFGSVLSKHSGDTTYPHNFMSVYGMKGRPSLHKHLAQGTDVCISDWTSTSITQPSVLTALSLNLVKCDVVNYLTNGNSPQKKATPLTLESSAPEGLKTSLQKCVHPCLHQTTGGSHDVPVDSSPVPVLKSPSTVSQSCPHVPVYRSHLPGSLGGVWFEKLHCPHLFLKKGSMAEKKVSTQKRVAEEL